MFNLLVKGNEWAAGRGTIPVGRVFEHTEQHLKDQYKPNGQLDFDSLVTFPTLFVKETFPKVLAQLQKIFVFVFNCR